MRLLKFLCKSLYNLTKATAMLAIVLFLAIEGRQIHNIALTYKVAPSVVLIGNKKGSEFGTGYHLKMPSGKVYIVTNRHVCEMSENKKDIYVLDKTYTGRPLARKIIKMFDKADLCLVEPFYNYPALRLAYFNVQFQEVRYFGYPLRQNLLHMGEGKIKGVLQTPLYEEPLPKGKKQQMVPGIEIDALTYPGASGSPVVDAFGNVVGTIEMTNTISYWGIMVPLAIMKETLKNY